MVRANKIPAAIEGSEILVVGQDIKPIGLPRPLKDSSGRVFPLTVHKRGESTIIEENSPKIGKFSQCSLLDKGYSISGPLLWGFFSEPLDRDSIKIGEEGRTSSHPGQSATITGNCFMTIIKGWRGDPLPIHPKKILLE